MTFTCTVAWCAFDGRNMAALRRHVRTVHPWLEARERAAAAEGYCAPHGARMPHYGPDGAACAPDSPAAAAEYRAARNYGAAR